MPPPAAAETALAGLDTEARGSALGVEALSHESSVRPESTVKMASRESDDMAGGA
jgi:hypothetical protein